MGKNELLRIFIGYDHRQTVAYTVLQYSLLKQAKRPISITPLNADTLPPINRKALTPFAYTRFLVPWLCGFEGWAVFMDLDMLVTADIGELFDHADDRYALMVVDTHHKFERASMMLLNCGHPANQVLTPEYVNTAKRLHELEWVADQGLVGFVPNEWNFIVGTDSPTPATPRLIHYTQGVPAHPELRDCDYAGLWLEAYKETTFTQDWESIMGNSIWAARLSDGKVVPRLHSSFDRDQQALKQDIDAVIGANASRAEPGPRFLERSAHETSETPLKTIRHLQLAQLGNIDVLAKRFKPSSLLEYGSALTRLPEGESLTLPSGEAVESFEQRWHVERVARYSDILGRDDPLPSEPVDGVFSIDYLQRFDPEDIVWMLDEIFSWARRFVYLSIACYVASEDNLHVTIKPDPWWNLLLKHVNDSYPDVRYFVALTRARTEQGKNRLVESHLTG